MVWCAVYISILVYKSGFYALVLGPSGGGVRALATAGPSMLVLPTVHLTILSYPSLNTITPTHTRPSPLPLQTNPLLPPRPLPIPTLKVRIAPKLITQSLRVSDLEIRRPRAHLGIQLGDQRLHALSRADDQFQRRGIGPGSREVADGEGGCGQLVRFQA